MSRRLLCLLLVVTGVALLPSRSPAPLVFRPGEGWTYEPVGQEGRWQRERAKDQLDVAQNAFNQADYGTALKAARRVVRTWPLSDYAPHAQYLVGRCYEFKRQDEKAFNEYQQIIEKYPKSEAVKDVLERQYSISMRFLDGQWFKLWNYIPIGPSMERTSELFARVVKNGPYSDVGPSAQLRVGAAREKEGEYAMAVSAYELAADRYNDRPVIAADAMYRIGATYSKLAAKAEYDQSAAGKAIAAFSDFKQYFPDDERVPKTEKQVTVLRTEQARGNFMIAEYYEKRGHLKGAQIYYNEVHLKEPNSPLAEEARRRIDSIKKKLQASNK